MNMFKSMGNMGYGTYHTLCDSYVLPVANYGAAVWGFADYPASQVLQNRIGRFYLGVHQFAANAVTRTEMDELTMQYSRWIDMARLFNRIQKMDESHLPKVVLYWDFMSRKNCWVSDLTNVMKKLGMVLPDMTLQSYDLEDMRKTAHTIARLEWKDDAFSKLKL